MKPDSASQRPARGASALPRSLRGRSASWAGSSLGTAFACRTSSSRHAAAPSEAEDVVGGAGPEDMAASFAAGYPYTVMVRSVRDRRTLTPAGEHGLRSAGWNAQRYSSG